VKRESLTRRRRRRSRRDRNRRSREEKPITARRRERRLLSIGVGDLVVAVEGDVDNPVPLAALAQDRLSESAAEVHAAMVAAQGWQPLGRNLRKLTHS